MNIASRSVRFAALALVGTLAFAGCQPTQPPPATQHTQYVVGLSPFLDEQSGDQTFRYLAGFLLEDMPLNSSLWIYDAYHLRTISHVEIPNKRAFESSRTRANQFAKPLQALKGFLASRNDPPEIDGLDFGHAVKLPQFMDFVGENFSQTNASKIVLVLGSPLYLDAKETSFSMRDDYFPSDGHLLASRDRSVYGRSERTNQLGSVLVYHGHFEDPWKSDLHRQKINRFWNLFLLEQGATLATLTGDMPTIFNALRSDPARQTGQSDQWTIDSTQTKIEMLRVTREVPIMDWITRELPSDHQPAPPSTTSGPMKIGIRWSGDLDIDLYAKARSYSEVMFYDHPKVAEGYYFKDHRSSPEREYEFIEFTESIDINEVRASINFYEGNSRGGVAGEVRLEFEGRIYTGKFQLDMEQGNQGRGGRGQEAYWQEIDVSGILGL